MILKSQWFQEPVDQMAPSTEKLIEVGLVYTPTVVLDTNSLMRVAYSCFAVKEIE